MLFSPCMPLLLGHYMHLNFLACPVHTVLEASVFVALLLLHVDHLSLRVRYIFDQPKGRGRQPDEPGTVVVTAAPPMIT